jgi:ribonuclease P protein component
MLTKINRLTKKKDFDRVFAEGGSSFNKLIGIKAAKNGLPHSRFGIIVSTKVSKKAVIRNTIKRRIREVIRGKLKQIKSGQDCVIIALPAIVEKDFCEIERSLTDNLSRVRLLQKSAEIKQ